jgi:spermidine synthase
MGDRWRVRWQVPVGDPGSSSACAAGPLGSVLWPLFLVSFATLYVEVMLIRWLGTEVRVFAYFQNLILIACFLGFGLGCYQPNRRGAQLFDLLTVAGLITLVQIPIPGWKEFLNQLSTLLALPADVLLWSEGPKITSGVVGLWLIAVFAMSAFLLFLIFVMKPLGQWVGFYLDAAPNPITAYSVNLIGSMAGIWVFASTAFLWLTPEWWFGLAFVLFLSFLLFLPSRQLSRRSVVLALVAIAVSLVLLQDSRSNRRETYWSPYQKLQVVSLGDQQYEIHVNNVGYMSIANTTADFLARHPDLAERYRRESSYDAPFRFARHRDRVLIVGAGAGNDAAAALRNDAGQVDTVEIDPVIYSLGDRLHPDHPYTSPKVHKVLDDARTFLRRTDKKYDVVVFGLLDSHTQFSDYSNMRLDSYVYTEEAFRQARQLLKPDGILIVKFAIIPAWAWIGQRFYAMLDQIFGRPPVVFSAPHIAALFRATVFITSEDSDLWRRAAQPELARLIAKYPPSFPLKLNSAPPAATDDWPYVYNRSRSIPGAYLTISLTMLAMAFLFVHGMFEPRRLSTWHFFFLGAGFLLLETQLISRLALYFGTTWLVNCVALTAILLMLVAANVYVARRRPRRLEPYYALLVGCLIANYLLPWHRLPYSAPAIGTLLSLAYCFPVFAAGIVFTETFRRCQRKSSAFGANIVGAVAGGLAQNISFIVGLKALLLAAVFFYALAAFCGRSVHQDFFAFEKTPTSPASGPLD